MDASDNWLICQLYAIVPYHFLVLQRRSPPTFQVFHFWSIVPCICCDNWYEPLTFILNGPCQSEDIPLLTRKLRPMISASGFRATVFSIPRVLILILYLFFHKRREYARARRVLSDSGARNTSLTTKPFSKLFILEIALFFCWTLKVQLMELFLSFCALKK